MSSSKFACFDSYRKWVIKNAEILSQIETLGRMASYLIAGRIKTSPAFSELLYSATNIVVFVNDQILINNAHHKYSDVIRETNLEKFRVLYTIMEYLQVFLEITASRFWGSRGKWTAITIIQSIKFLWRIIMIVTQQAGLAKSRPIPPLNRKKLRPNEAFNFKGATELTDNSQTFSLKSGRLIRQINGAPHINRRNWKLPISDSLEMKENVTETKLQGLPLLGEVLYSVKPLCHLVAMGRCGTNSWIPWSLALALDIASIKLLKSGVLNCDDQKEIRRRQLTLLMYLLRSPFYDRFSRKVIFQILTSLKKIPLIGVLPQQILQYALFWQKIYSYTWD